MVKKKFVEKSGLLIHLAVHPETNVSTTAQLSETKFACPKCPKQFVFRYQMKTHNLFQNVKPGSRKFTETPPSSKNLIRVEWKKARDAGG